MAKAKNEFLQGKYKGKIFVKRMDGKLSILDGWKQIMLDETNISNIEIMNQEQSKDTGSTVARGLVGGVLLGPVGLLAGAMLGKNSSINMITITFTDGQKSLVEVDKDIFDRLMTIKWNLDNKANEV